MCSSSLLDSLRNPLFYDEPVRSIEVIQTHISYVALTGDYAYKIKKPVNLGFLDFSTLEKRRYYCEEEVRLNKRLCPSVYLGVLPVTKDDDVLRVNGEGEVVDYVVKMKQFPQDDLMCNLLEKGEVDEDVIDRICSILVDFYNKGERSGSISSYGSVYSIKVNIDENFNQTESFVDVTIPRSTYMFLREVNNEFLSRRRHVFNERMRSGFIRDCHGDLHSGNIVVSDDDVYIFDCIEFNDRFRYSDVAADIGFLAMDLDYRNQPYLSSHLIDRYIELTGDKDVLNVLNFYKSYRAYVRGKVLSFQLNDPVIGKDKYKKITEDASRYFDLSSYYASLFTYDLRRVKPFMIITSGLTGTGKSTVAKKITIDYNAEYLNTDIIRKEGSGDVFKHQYEEYNKGLYQPDRVDDVYDKMFKRCRGYLDLNRGVVLDGTFIKSKHRTNVKAISQEYKADLVMVHCVCPEDTVRKRLDERMKRRSVSDGRWEIYLSQRRSFEPFREGIKHLDFDTSNESYSYRLGFYKKLVESLK